MKIAVGSLNKAKNEAVRDVFGRIWNDCEFNSVETDSKVNEQPRSSDEAITGAINRARAAIISENSDFGVGLEGTVDTNSHGMFLLGWVAVIDASGKIGLGSSGAIQVPSWMRSRIESGEEMGPIVKEIMQDEDNLIRHGQGASGILTKGMYSRIHEFKDAVMCALSPFVSEQHYY
ncbi:MAG: DUF84 family protein [Candidatus Woesearchaeota archaeon]